MMAVQIVGLKSGWHAAAVMGTSQFHGLRLAHAAEMRLELLAHGECMIDLSLSDKQAEDPGPHAGPGFSGSVQQTLANERQP